MTIHWDATAREWHLENGRVSFAMRVLENGWLGHLHAGAPVRPGGSLRHLGPTEFPGYTNRVGEPVGLEVPVPGVGDFRVPALVVEGPDGSTVLDLRYADAPDRRRQAGPAGSPVDLRRVRRRGGDPRGRPRRRADRPVGHRADDAVRGPPGGRALAHARQRRRGAARRSGARCRPSSTSPTPTGASSPSAGPGRASGTCTTGPSSTAASPSGSLRGASGAEHSPFLALRRATTTEDAGEAYGLSLVYSGNFLAEAEVDAFGTTRLRIGIHPEAFAWRLEPGAAFTTPEAVIAWSGEGLGGLSEAFHGLYRERMARGPWRDRPRPIVLNNWEATYFDFDHERIVGIAGKAKDLGVGAVRARRRLVRPPRQRRLVAGRLDRRPAQAPGRHRGARARRPRPRPRLRPVDRARDGERGQRPVPRPPRLGDRRPRPRADARAASSWSSTSRGPRSSTTSPTR